ncbi:MAG: glutathione S-transferase family protein [Betaproteobacteria bacterium]|nr:glutathione S-transferase family protein [Betaproteobacteria bacterium]
MKLYYHPVSTTCRPILLFAAESGIELQLQLVDLFTGEHLVEAYGAINPSRQVPVLEDGDFRLTESASILKYLADKVGSPAYPKDLRERAHVNEMMDWFNTGLYRDLGYGLVYPQVLPTFKRADEKVQAATVAWGREKSRNWLTILDRNLLGPRNPFVCGDSITLADYLGAAFLTVGEVIRLDYSPWPNVKRWLDRMKARPSWAKVNEGFYAHFVTPFANAPFEGL